MKYTKTAAALALAGMTAAPLAQADGHGGGPTVTLSGGIGINLGSDDLDATDDRWSLSGDDAVLNVSATDTLSNGLEGYGNLRIDNALTGSSSAGDNIYIGVKGDFGDIRLGEISDALEYGQVAGDILDDIGGENAGIGYTGTFGNVGVGLNWSPAGNTDQVAAGIKFNAAGFGIGLGFADRNDASRMSVGATYALGGASLALAYKDFDGYESIGGKVGWSVGDIGLGLTYEARQGDGGVADNSQVRLDASYGLGGGWAVSGRVNLKDAGGTESTMDDPSGAVDATGAPVQVQDPANTDYTDYRIQFSKSF